MFGLKRELISKRFFRHQFLFGREPKPEGERTMEETIEFTLVDKGVFCLNGQKVLSVTCKVETYPSLKDPVQPSDEHFLRLFN